MQHAGLPRPENCEEHADARGEGQEEGGDAELVVAVLCVCVAGKDMERMLRASRAWNMEKPFLLAYHEEVLSGGRPGDAVGEVGREDPTDGQQEPPHPGGVEHLCVCWFVMDYVTAVWTENLIDCGMRRPPARPTWRNLAMATTTSPNSATASRSRARCTATGCDVCLMLWCVAWF